MRTKSSVREFFALLGGASAAMTGGVWWMTTSGGGLTAQLWTSVNGDAFADPSLTRGPVALTDPSYPPVYAGVGVMLIAGLTGEIERYSDMANVVSGAQIITVPNGDGPIQQYGDTVAYQDAMGNGVHCSLDQGLTWSLRAGPGGGFHYLGRLETGRWLAYSDQYYYSDASAPSSGSWTATSTTGQPVRIVSSATSAIAVNNGSTYLRTTDGVSWQTITHGFGVNSLDVFIGFGSTYLGCRTNYVYRSIDDGLTWEKIPTLGMLAGHPVYAPPMLHMVRDSVTGTIVGSGTLDGIYVSHDDGATWVVVPIPNSITGGVFVGVTGIYNPPPS